MEANASTAEEAMMAKSKPEKVKTKTKARARVRKPRKPQPVQPGYSWVRNRRNDHVRPGPRIRLSCIGANCARPGRSFASPKRAGMPPKYCPECALERHATLRRLYLRDLRKRKSRALTTGSKFVPIKHRREGRWSEMAAAGLGAAGAAE